MQDTQQPVTLKAGANRGLLQYQPGITELFIAIMVEVAESIKAQKSNSCLLIDRSGSMKTRDSGTKTRFQAAIDAAILFVQNLNLGDFFSLVTYCEIAEVYIPATEITESSRSQIVHKIHQLTTSGDDVMSRGLEKAAQELAKHAHGTISTCYIACDGTSMGYDNREFTWCFEQYKNRLSQAQEEAECVRLADTMRTAGYQVIGMAFGSGCRRGFLGKVTKNPERYINSAADALQVFGNEVQIATNIKLRDCGLWLNMAKEVDVTRITQVYPDNKVYDIDLGNPISIPLGDVESKFVIVLEVQVSQPDNTGQLELVNAIFQYNADQPGSITQPIKVGFQNVAKPGREIEWVAKIVADMLFMRRITQAERDLKIMGRLSIPLLSEDINRLRKNDATLADLLEQANSTRISETALRQIETKTHSLSRRLDEEIS